MIKCPQCNSEDISILEENGFATIRGYAEVNASCKCADCGCIFDVCAEGDFVTCSDDYQYQVAEWGDEDV